MTVTNKAISPVQKSSVKAAATPNQVSYWSQPPETLMKTLASSSNGLSQAQAANKLDEVGHNVLATKSEVTAVGLFLNQFKSPIMLILIFATVTSAALGDLTDAVIITLIVLGSAIL